MQRNAKGAWQKMTEEDAKKIRAAFANGYQFSAGNKESAVKESDRLYNLLDTALNKQIEQPTNSECINTDWGTTLERCPGCNAYIEENKNKKYCDKCGQAIKWKGDTR